MPSSQAVRESRFRVTIFPQKIAWGGEASSFFGEASEEESLSVENDVGFAKPDVGSGVWGHGAPRTAILFGKDKMFADGFGFCSPGRWFPQQRRSSKYHCSAATDNKGNSHVVARLLTTTYPLCVCLMELALQLQSQGIDLRLEWLRRDLNQEADDLTNGVYGQFSLEKRLRFDLSDFEGIILMMAAGGDLYGEIAASKPESCRGPCKKQKKADGADPWQKHNAKAGGNKYKKENAPGGRSPRWGGCLSCPLLHVLG